MTRRLGGTGKGGLNGLATLSLGALMGCCLALAGCSDDNGGGSSTTTDGGSDTGVLGDGAVEATADASDARADAVVTDAPTTDSAVVDAGPQCATPAFSVAAGSITAGTSVTLTSAGLPANAFIYFTVDGSLPTHTSPVVSSGGSIVINSSETLRAIAYAAGVCTDSAYETAYYSVLPPDSGADAAPLPQCDAPVIAPNGGTVAAGAQISLSSATLPADGYIFYTTDGSLPNTLTSPVATSGGTITLDQSATVRALAYAAGECSASANTTAVFTVTQPVQDSGPDVAPLSPCPTPTFAPVAGTINSGTNIVISATGLPSSGYIFFTTDNSLPGRGSPIYNAGTVGFPLSATSTVRAISSTLGTTCTDSPVAVAAYTVTQPEAGPPPDAGPDATTEAGPPPATPAEPTFSPTGTAATQANDFTVSLSDTTTTATICYTLGATPPTCTTTGGQAVCTGGALTYSTPLTVNSTVTTGGNVEIQALACVPGAAPSGVSASQFTLQAAKPTFNQAAGIYTYSASLTGTFLTATSGATIRYTTDGSTPSCATSAVYTAPFVLQTGTYSAVACKVGYADSQPSAATAITVNLSAPAITPATGTYSTALNGALSNNAANPAGSWICSTEVAAGAAASTPACGATSSTCATGTPGTTFPAVASGGKVSAIACAVGGMSSPIVSNTYTLNLGTPFINPNSTNNAGAALTTFVVGAGVTSVTAAEPAGDVSTGVWFCFLKDKQFATGAVCGATTQACTQGHATLADLMTDLSANSYTYIANDFVTVVACPSVTSGDASFGYAPGGPVTLAFISTTTVAPPNVSPDSTSPLTVITSPVLTNVNSTPATLCYTTDNTTPTCTPGSTAANCSTVSGLTDQTMSFQVTSGGTGYVNPPTVALSSGSGACTGTPVATVGSGAITGITVSGCSGYTTPPLVTLTPGAPLSTDALSAAISETIAVTVTQGGSGYGSTTPAVSLAFPANPTVNLCSGTVTCTVVMGTGSAAGTVVGVTVGSWGNTTPPNAAAPIVTFDNTGTTGSGASATAALTQTIEFDVERGLSAKGAVSASNYIGSNFTVAPAVKLSVTATNNGTCGTPVVALGTTTGLTDKIVSITATGCSGFSAQPTGYTVALQGPPPLVDAQPNPAAATVAAIASNMWSLPAIQTPTTLKAAACQTGLTQSATTIPTGGNPYTFAVASPIIISQTDVDNANEEGLTIPGPLTATNTMVLSTTSNFAGEFLVYKAVPPAASNAVPVDCSGPGASSVNGAVTVAGNTVTLGPAQIPPNNVQTDVYVIACGSGTNQTKSAIAHTTVTAGEAADFPQISSVANGHNYTKYDTLTTGDPSATQGAITAQNLVTATIVDPNPGAGSFVCYRTDATTPDCTCTAAGDTKVTTASTVLNVTALANTTITAVGCALKADGTLASPSATASVSYNISITPLAAPTSATLTCPAAYTLAENTSLETADGPTVGTVTTCYGLVQPTTCSGTQPAGVNCVTTPTASISFSGDTNSTSLFALQCATGFPNQASTLSISPTKQFGPSVIDPTTDAALGAWSTTSGELVAGTVSSLEGGFTYALPALTTTPGVPVVTTFDVATGGIALAAHNGLAVYLSSNHSTAGNTTTTPEVGTATLPFPAEYAIIVPLTAACTTTCAPVVYKFNGTTWASVADVADITAIKVTASTVEFSILPSLAHTFPDLVNSTTVSAAGAYFTGTVLNGEWPAYQSAWGYFDVPLNSCVTPASWLQ
ncbi:MAG: FN3 associated domain-containing protein [Polyangiaceae bacterium]